MNYVTQWAIWDSKEKLIFRYSGKACFADFTRSSSAIKFDPDYEIRVYIPLCFYGHDNLIGSLKFNAFKPYIEWFVNKLCKLGFKVDISYEKFKSLSYYGIENIDFNKELDSIVYKLQFRNYKTKAELKIILHILRFLWEYKCPRYVEKFMKASPKCINFIRGFNKILSEGRQYSNGHGFILPQGMGNKEFKEFLDSIKDIPYNDSEIYKLQNYEIK